MADRLLCLVMGTLLGIMIQQCSSAYAADFGDAATELEWRVEGLEGRVRALEENRPPPDPGVPDPPPPPECLSSQVEVDQEPFPLVPNRIPGRFQAQEFDIGDNGVAYFDTTPGNTGGMFRTLVDVDIKATGDESGNYQVGWIKDTEWLEYTVCADAGLYDLVLRVASNVQPQGGNISAYVDGELAGSVTVPYTGCWDECFEIVEIRGIEVRAGNQIVRLAFSGTWLDINWFEFVPQDVAGNQPPYDIILCKPMWDGRPDLSDCDEGSYISPERRELLGLPPG